MIRIEHFNLLRRMLGSISFHATYEEKRIDTTRNSDVIERSSISAHPGRKHQYWPYALKVGGRLLAVGGIVFLLLACRFAYRYDLSFRRASFELLRQGLLGTIRVAMAVFDPCKPHHAVIGPTDADAAVDRNPRLDQILIPGKPLLSPSGSRVTTLAVNNPTIVRSPFPFGYQPHDDARLRDIRTLYQLDRVVESAYSEFDAMVRIRGWARSLYRRIETQDQMENFNAIELFGRRKRSMSEDPSIGDYDPCHLFPLLYAQLMTSMGHQARIMSVGHGIVEVWSNEFSKWVLMDTEFDHHFEKDGIPLSVFEMLEASYAGSNGIRLVRGDRFPMLENLTMVHLKVEQLTAEMCIPWFKAALEVADMRNDWLTNHYFVGHPSRSEANSLVYIDPRLNVEPGTAFRIRMRPKTSKKSEAYWTLNQAEIHYRSWKGEGLELVFDTVTPNFDFYEIVVDGKEVQRNESSRFFWRLHKGENTLVVRPVNKFGVVGVESTVTLGVDPSGSS